MITIYNDNGLKVEANRGSFASSTLSAYVGERTYLHVTSINSHNYVTLLWDLVSGIYQNTAKFVLSGSVVDIDITDIVRGLDGTISMAVDNDVESAPFALAKQSLMIDPEDVHIPDHDADAIVQLPHKIYSKLTENDNLQFAFIRNSGDAIYKRKGPSWTLVTGNLISYTRWNGNVQIARLVNGTYEILQVIRAEALPCGIEAVDVEWVDRFGITNHALIPSHKYTEGLDKATEYASIDNSYIVGKSTINSLTLKMDGLTAYDYWYYAAIVNSQSVKVNGQSVYVTSKKVTIPDGKEFYTLEIEVNYKRYDEV